MENTKFVKARCRRTGKYFALEVKKFGLSWRVVNVDELAPDKARMIASEVKQGKFNTNDTLLPCSKCGGRRIGGCSCPQETYNCSADMEYHLDCAYCDCLEIDYSQPSRRATAGHEGKTVTVQGKEIRVVNFSNVEWEPFDNVKYHENGRLRGFFSEPRTHVKAKDEDIEFHGYNVSQMDEGVFYEIGENDDFEIECDVNTSGIMPHPGGYLYINFGLIRANIMQTGGTFYLGGHPCATVGNRFKMRLSLTNEGKYTVYIDGEKKGEKINPSQERTKIIFGFNHGPHCCSSLSHATLSNIKMTQGVAQ